MLDVSLIPSGATISTQLCKVGGQCITNAVPDGAEPRPRNRPGTNTRVGLHAYDKSYVQFYFGNNKGIGVNANVSVEYSVTGQDNSEIDMLVTPVDCGADGCGSYTLQVRTHRTWGQPN